MKPQRLTSRRQFLKLAAASAGGALLAACTQPQAPAEPKPAQKEEAATPAPPEPVELRIHVRTGAEGEKTQMGIDAFQEYNPNITVKLEDFPGDQYADKLLTLAAGDTMGDVAFTHVGFYHAMADAGFWKEVDPLVDEYGYDMSQYFETGLDHMRWNGKLYGLPYKGHTGPSLIWYNEEMLAEEGIDELEINDYDELNELIEVAKMFTKDTTGDGKTDQWGYLYTGHHGWTVTGHLRAWGVDPVSPKFGATKAELNGEKQVAALRWIHDMLHVHKVCPLPGSLNYNEIFIAGTAAMRCGYLTMSGEQVGIGDRFTQKHIMMPDGPAGPTGFYNHDQMAMSAKTKDVDASWKLLTYFCGKEQGIRLGLPEGGGAASCGMRRDVYGDPEFIERIPAVATVAKTLERVETHWYADNLQTFKVWNAIGQSLDAIMLEPNEPTQADFDEVNDAVQNVLDEPRM
jgi:multiple sugar transport system substrate-binding protein